MSLQARGEKRADIWSSDVRQEVANGICGRHSILIDLGSLPGPDKCSAAYAVNEAGEAVGNSEIDQIDPILGLFQIRAVLWKNGQIIELGTAAVPNAVCLNRGFTRTVCAKCVPALQD